VDDTIANTDYIVVAQHHLLRTALRVLDDVDLFAARYESGVLIERDGLDVPDARIVTGDDREIEILIGKEEPLGRQANADGFTAFLEIEDGEAAFRPLFGFEDVIVSHDEARSHQEPGAGVANVYRRDDGHPADGGYHLRPVLQKAGRQEIRRLVDLFEVPSYVLLIGSAILRFDERRGFLAGRGRFGEFLQKYELIVLGEEV
jgi:hypothetical protein